MRIYTIGIGLGLAAALVSLGHATAGEAQRELGRVGWSRDFEAAVAESGRSGRPLFALFQEVPGCATCVGFGKQALSDPLLVESIETDFVPVAILNNRPGRDAALLARFGEPGWNNPVVRFLDAQGRDLIPRADRIWKRHDLATRMIRALEAAERAVPAHLELLAYETAARETRRVAFGMHCFWSGEACLGSVPGVISTRAGWHGGVEIVEVGYDPAEISYAQLLLEARRRGCAESVYAATEAQRDEAAQAFGPDAVRQSPGAMRAAPASDQKRHLRASPFAEIELTPLQATRVNASLGSGGDPRRWLSPRQQAASMPGGA